MAVVQAQYNPHASWHIQQQDARSLVMELDACYLKRVASPESDSVQAIRSLF
jgi:hypothetical protein